MPGLRWIAVTMTRAYVSAREIQDLPLWAARRARRALFSFDLEITARCNLDCRHCYINLSAGDAQARARELSAGEIDDIAAQAAELGAMWCLITGGEPLLRPDFPDIYLALKRRGLLVSVFTTATLVDRGHVELFRHYPPRDLEVTVYGTTRETYERVTRRPGSFDRFRRGLDMLLAAGVPVRLKAMALRSNVDEMGEIARFCRERTRDFFRFDPQLHLRFDGNPARNAEIRAERLSPQEVVALERSDAERLESMERDCALLIDRDRGHDVCNHLFHCGTGRNSFNVGYDGTFRLCSSLWAPGTTYDLRRGSLRDAWESLVPRVRAMRSADPRFLETCRACELVNLCLWCPAHAHLETGRLDGEAPFFCAVARERAQMLG